MFSSVKADYEFKELLQALKDYGSHDENPRPKYKDDTPAHTIYLTDVKNKYWVSDGELPFSTLRNVAVKTGIREIMWIYQKQSNCLTLAKEMGIHWWSDWDIGDGTIGQRYGATIKKYDIMNKLLKGLVTDPFGRRHIIDMWQYEDFETTGLNPCMYNTTFMVRRHMKGMYLDVIMKQRSNDTLCANTINKAQYLALGLMICSHLRHHTGVNWTVGTLSHQVDNAHIYDRHVDAAEEMLLREVDESKQHVFELPVNKDFYDIELEDFVIKLNCGEKIKSELELAI